MVYISEHHRKEIVRRDLRNLQRAEARRNLPAAMALLLLGLTFSLPTWTQPTGSTSKCTLPVPDGGDFVPSAANLTGKIKHVGKDFVDVQPMKGRNLVRVFYDSDTQLYSAFGGDYEPSDFVRGQRVWVWFKGCRPAARSSGKAAYLQLYSRDPKDQPSE